MAQTFTSCECRIIANPLGNRDERYVCNKYVGPLEQIWFAQHFFDGICCRLLAFTDMREFERFYKNTKKKFKHENTKKQFFGDAEYPNGSEIYF